MNKRHHRSALKFPEMIMGYPLRIINNKINPSINLIIYYKVNLFILLYEYLSVFNI